MQVYLKEEFKLKKGGNEKNMKVLLPLFFLLLLIGFASASFGFNNLVSDSADVGTFPQGNINLIQTCDNCTYNNITSIFYPQSNTFINKSETSMEKSGTLYNYSFYLNQTGTYVVTGHGDDNGTDTAWILTFKVGNDLSIGAFFVILIIAFVISFIGLYTRNEYFAILGGFAIGYLALFTFNNGITLYRSTLTDAFSVFLAALGLFFIVMGLEEVFNKF